MAQFVSFFASTVDASAKIVIFWQDSTGFAHSILRRQLSMGSDEYTYFHCPPQCPSVERFKATITRRRFPAHSHDGFVVGIVHHGTQEFTHRGVVHRAHAGSLIFLNPEELHSVRAADVCGVSYQTLHVPARMLHDIGGNTFRFQRAVEYAPQFANKLTQTLEALDATTAVEFWNERLSEILVDLVVRQDSTRQHVNASFDRRMHDLIEHIGHHITTPLSVTTLAGHAAMSQQHLIRIFKQSTGVTPHTYIQARRTALAKQMLHNSTPADAAISAGFADQSHLTRWMKACYGTTPAIYRKFIEKS